MPNFLYRFLENDEDGDPLDFGVLTAVDVFDARAQLTSHLRELRGNEETCDVRIYRLDSDASKTASMRGQGIWPTTHDYDECQLSTALDGEG